MSYNPLHDCPSSPCVVPGKLAGQGQVFLGLSLNDTVAIAALAALMTRTGGDAIDRGDAAVEYAFNIADEFCAQRFARAKRAQVDAARSLDA